jgi:hypothetical protein
MSRATRKLPLAAFAVLGALALAASASALDPEGAAKAALKRASEKYLATDFPAAMAILKKAAKGCGSTRCSSGTRAALLRDIGVMQFRAGDKAAAQKSFTDAVALDPNLALNADYDAPDVRAAFNAAKPGGGKSEGGKSEGGGGEAVAAPSGDFSHTPATEQKVNTPLPVYAEISGGGIRRAAVRYKGASMNDWARVDMKRVGDGWGATIPCKAVTVGTMRYWIQGYDADGNSAASSGDAKHPFEVPIREEITSEAPHLPGRPAPESCEEGEEGEERHAEHEEEPAESGGEHEKRPVPSSSAYARWWVGVAGAIDFLSLPGAADACALNPSSAAPANTAGYYCTNPDGSDFPTRVSPGQNASLVAGNAGTVGGGFQPGDLRALLALDYALNPSMLVGARLGYVLNSYPTSGQAVHDHQAFGSKIHFELRGTYVFGDAPLTHEGFAPTVFVAAGLAEFDGHVSSIVSMNEKTTLMGGGTATETVSQPVNVWRMNGPWFLALGGGARYQLSPRAAFNAVVRANAAFGGAGMLLTFGPEIGFQYGF